MKELFRSTRTPSDPYFAYYFNCNCTRGQRAFHRPLQETEKPRNQSSMRRRLGLVFVRFSCTLDQNLGHVCDYAAAYSETHYKNKKCAVRS